MPKLKYLAWEAYESLLKKAREWDEEDWEVAHRYARHAVNAACDIRDLMEENDRLRAALMVAGGAGC